MVFFNKNNIHKMRPVRPMNIVCHMLLWAARHCDCQCLICVVYALTRIFVLKHRISYYTYQEVKLIEHSKIIEQLAWETHWTLRQTTTLKRIKINLFHIKASNAGSPGRDKRSSFFRERQRVRLLGSKGKTSVAFSVLSGG